VRDWPLSIRFVEAGSLPSVTGLLRGNKHTRALSWATLVAVRCGASGVLPVPHNLVLVMTSDPAPDKLHSD
jgi:hypothetical protein